MEIDVVGLIQNLGFPIACCIALFYRMSRQDEMHREEINALKSSLDDNTRILTKLYEHIGGDNNGPA